MQHEKIKIYTNKLIEFTVEMPETAEEYHRGLAFRDNLPAQTGMLYFYNNEHVGMYTPQTKIPVDFIFIDLCGNIIKIARDVQPLSYELHECYNVAAVLEINKGEADKLGIKEGDIIVDRFCTLSKNCAKLTIRNADCYCKYGKDLYAKKDKELYFYSYKSHSWYSVKSTHQEQNIANRIMNYSAMKIKKVEISEKEAELFIKQYENELRSDYAKTLKHFYRLHEKLFYSHDEINNRYQLYTFRDGWIDMSWISNPHRTFIMNKQLSLRLTSKEVENLTEMYKEIVIENDYEEDICNLKALHYYTDGDPNNLYYLVLGGTLWCINEVTKSYQTFDSASNKWMSMSWLGNKLSHEVECAKHTGQKLDYMEVLEKCQELANNYRKNIKNRKLN